MIVQPAGGGTGGAGQPVQAGASPSGDRVVSEEDKKLAADWHKRIQAALKRVEKKFKKFEAGRKRLAALVPNSGEAEEKTDRAPLHFANMAALLPQVYAKDPEFAAKPTRAVPASRMEAAKGFASTAEFMLQKVVVKDANLKKQAKKQIRSCYATSVGWLKASWQEGRPLDPLIANRIKDTQDNIQNVQRLLDESNDPQACEDHELTIAKLKQALEGLQGQAEVKVGRGIALDFVMSEDLVVLDPSIRSLSDYTRAAALAHRVWMTPEQYERNFGYKPKKAKSYTEHPGTGTMSAQGSTEQNSTLVCVWEIWSQDDNRIYTVCDGEEGFCKDPFTPDWTGKRWYCFFLVAFNELDGSFYPLSDIELTDKLVKEYNESREDFVRDRKEALPIKVVRKGGSLTDEDIKNLQKAKGGDTVLVEGVGNQPLTNDMWMGQLGKLDAAAYDTSAARYDMERVLGGADTNTGSITKAKTATEAEILSQGLRSRAGERQDVLEDMLNELGPYCLEMMLRKFSPQEVVKMAGEDAVWPQLALDDIFNLVTVEVRGGSTGKPDRLQEQDRWSKLLPIITDAVQKVSELRAQQQEPMAQAVIELTRETLRRFDERLDIEEFLPKPAKGQEDPNALKQQVFTLTQQLQDTQAKLKDAADKVEKGFIAAAADIATSQNPAAASVTFTQLIGMPMPDVGQIVGAMPPMPQGPEQPGEPTDVTGQPEEPDPLSQPQAALPPQDDANPAAPQPDLPQP